MKIDKLLVWNALIWSAVILLASWLFKDGEQYQILFGVLVVAAGLTNALIHNARKKHNKIVYSSTYSVDEDNINQVMKMTMKYLT
jgi:hypothetical protein